MAELHPASIHLTSKLANLNSGDVIHNILFLLLLGKLNFSPQFTKTYKLANSLVGLALGLVSVLVREVLNDSKIKSYQKEEQRKNMTQSLTVTLKIISLVVYI